MKNIRTARRVTQDGIWRLAAVTLALGLVLSVSGHTWQGEAGTTAMDGAELFKTFCASCHGVEATGNGPVAHALRHAPADLTLIAKKNGGTFPTARVNRIILGWDIESHGDRDMPVWGDPFTLTRDGRFRDGAEARIAAIVPPAAIVVRVSGPMSGSCGPPWAGWRRPSGDRRDHDRSGARRRSACRGYTVAQRSHLYEPAFTTTYRLRSTRTARPGRPSARRR